jgi:hypothetical protein
MKTRCLFLSCFIVTALGAQQLPETEIYLFDMKKGKKGIVLSSAENMTNHPGYDNQPFFHPDKPLIYYSSSDTSGRTDIVEYNYNTKSSRKLTNTSEREYSPTVTPDKKFISCIIQRDNGQQDLGKYPVDGGDPVIIINTLKIGYHAWADDTHLLMFVLGEPNTLNSYSTSEKKGFIINDSIGRSIHRVPRSSFVSFVDKGRSAKWIIKKISLEDGIVEPVVETLPQREDLAWTNDGVILMSDGEKIFFLKPGKKQNWKQAEYQSGTSIKSITRLAINREGTKLAVVVSQ